MTNKTTFQDIETLTEAKDKIEQLQEQYLELSGEAKEQHFEEIVKLQEQVEQAEKRMIKRIKKVVVLNEMEEARRAIAARIISIPIALGILVAVTGVNLHDESDAMCVRLVKDDEGYFFDYVEDKNIIKEIMDLKRS